MNLKKKIYKIRIDQINKAGILVGLKLSIWRRKFIRKICLNEKN